MGGGESDERVVGEWFGVWGRYKVTGHPASSSYRSRLGRCHEGARAKFVNDRCHKENRIGLRGWWCVMDRFEFAAVATRAPSLRFFGLAGYKGLAGLAGARPTVLQSTPLPFFIPRDS